MENLWRAATQATLHVLKTYRFYGLVGYDRKYLIDECILHCVRHFLEFKIGQKKYNRDFPFLLNVMSSAWSVQGNIANKLVKDMIDRYHMNNIDDVGFALSTSDTFPRYLSLDEAFHRRKKSLPFEKKRPSDKARLVRQAYEDYLCEADELGISNKLSFDAWIARNGYNKDEELMLGLEPRDIRRKLIAEHARIMKESELTESERHSREYMREWQRRYRQKKLLEQSAEYEKVYGKPPEGFAWRLRGNIVGLQKLKEADK